MIVELEQLLPLFDYAMKLYRGEGMNTIPKLHIVVCHVRKDAELPAIFTSACSLMKFLVVIRS
jgi:hypothetical protein